MNMLRGSLRCMRGYSTVARADLFKEAMAGIGSQAMVLTAPFEGKPIVGDMHGMTISSVSSLCVQPAPLIQFNLQIPSITSETLHRLPHFAIHVLPPTMNSVSIARSFAQGTRTKKDAYGNVVHTRPFASISVSEWETHRISDTISIPILKSAERVLICSKSNVFEVLNHEIWVGKVEDILVHPELGDKTGGLIYFNRRFHSVGGKLED